MGRAFDYWQTDDANRFCPVYVRFLSLCRADGFRLAEGPVEFEHLSAPKEGVVFADEFFPPVAFETRSSLWIV